MSQERGQRSIRSFFSPSPRPTAVGGGDAPVLSPNENVSMNVQRTPNSSQKRQHGRALAVRTGIHVFDDSPVSSLRPDVPSAKRVRVSQEVDLSDCSEDDSRPTAAVATESPISSRASATVTNVTQTPTSTVRRFASTPISSPSAAASPRTPAASLSTLASTPQTAVAGGDDDASADGSEWPPKDAAYRFLWPQFIRDADGRRPDDPDYDPTTLRVPADFIASQTDTKQQWWKMKSKHFDTVLFFKVGKFYELFYMDSIVGIEELNLSPMGGSRLHTGFPEKSIQKYMDILRERHYRVARVEQTESNTAREQRVRTGHKEKNVVNREICQIVTPGTARDVQVDGDTGSKYLMSLCQVVLDQEEQTDSSDKFIFAVCFVDTTIGKFSIGQFKDDRSCSRLRSLLAYCPPVEILIERKGLSPEASSVISMWIPSASVRPLVRDKQFYSPTQTLKLLHDGRYFEQDGHLEYPEVLKQMLDSSDPLMQTPLLDHAMAVKAFGGVLFYLKYCLIDEELLTMRLFEKFVPADAAAAAKSGIDPSTGRSCSVSLPKHLILDSLTLNHLDIFDSDLGVETSLFGILNHTETKFGQRLLRFWISFPLTCIKSINDRLDAIDDLSTQQMLMQRDSLFAFLKNMPDLERLLNFAHTQGMQRKNDHPDARAQLFEDYDKKKIQQLVDLVSSFHKTLTALQKLRPLADKFKSSLLKSLVTLVPAGGQFPDVEQVLRDFESANDLSEARETGKVKPDQREGSAYAEVMRRIRHIETQLQSLLDKEAVKFGSRLKFSNSGKKKYLMEVSTNVFDRSGAGSRYRIETKKKTSVLFYIPEVLDLLPQLEQLEVEQENLVGQAQRLMFAQFSAHAAEWSRAIRCIAAIDVLLSLAKVRTSLQSQFITMSRPEFIQLSDSQSPELHVCAGKHPILAKLDPNFVANDLSITDKLMIVTGPNMGGKSTLMRQTGLITIMAQIGSFVPASKVRMTPVDRVFTRLGAMDRISDGESTFFVELSETSTILRHATRFSLVLLDELGRGTSTHDGTAVAYAVVHSLSQQKRCRTLFSTHYHNLVDEFAGSDRVSSCHMSCQVPSAESGSVQEVTFLYRVASGNCPKSHGFNVARKAGLPDSVVLIAQEAAARLEQRTSKQKILKRLMRQLTQSHAAGADVSQLRHIVIQMKEVSLSDAP